MSRTAWTKELRTVVNAIDRNTRGLAKVASAADWIRDLDELGMWAVAAIEILERARFDLVQERRNLRARFCKELNRQEGWHGR